MGIHLVAFNLTNKKWNYSDFFSLMEDFNRKKLNKSSYLVQTQLSPKAVYDKLRPHISPLDTLFVIKQTAVWHGHGENEVVDWVVARLNKPENRFPQIFANHLSY